MKKVLIAIISSVVISGLVGCTDILHVSEREVQSVHTDELVGYVIDSGESNIIDNSRIGLSVYKTSNFDGFVTVCYTYTENDVEYLRSKRFEITDFTEYMECISSIGEPRIVYRDTTTYVDGYISTSYRLGDLINNQENVEIEENNSESEVVEHE